MSKFKARALEGVLGGVLGGSAGGLGSAVFHETREPREWSDEYGNVYDRPLTDEERATRRQAVSRAALIGALGGGAASLGASALLGRRIAKVERSQAKEAIQDTLSPFRELIQEYRDEALRPPNAKSRLALRASKRVEVANRLYQEGEAAAEEAVKTVMDRRGHLPFRGALHPADSGSVDWRSLSSTHLVDKHFDRLATKHGFPPVFSRVPRTRAESQEQLETAKRVFDRIVDDAMTKTSSEAFGAELVKIAKFDVPAAAVGAALAALALSSGHSKDGRQDRMLRDLGALTPEEVQRRRRSRQSVLAGLAAAGGLVGGFGSPVVRKRVEERLSSYLKNTLQPSLDAAKDSLESAATHSAQALRQEADDLLKAQAVYGQELLENNMAKQAEEAGAGFIRGMLNPFWWGKKSLGAGR